MAENPDYLKAKELARQYLVAREIGNTAMMLVAHKAEVDHFMETGWMCPAESLEEL